MVVFIGGALASRLARGARGQPDVGPTPIATGVQSLLIRACNSKRIYYKHSEQYAMIVAIKLAPSQMIVKPKLLAD